MAVKTQVINLALMKLGASPVNAPDQNHPHVRIAAACWDTVVERVLRTHPWSFALKWIAGLAELNTLPLGFSHAYALPDDCIRVVDLRCSPDMTELPERFLLVGQALCTDAVNPWLRYVSREDRMQQWPADFTEAVACLLAAECATLIAQDGNALKAMTQLYAVALDSARLNDMAADNPEILDDESGSELLQARMY